MTQKQYIGIREHAGTDFIVSPGRPDIWRKYIAGYELIKFSIYITLHQENRIFDEKGYTKVGVLSINCVRIVACGFLAKLIGPDF